MMCFWRVKWFSFLINYSMLIVFLNGFHNKLQNVLIGRFILTILFLIWTYKWQCSMEAALLPELAYGSERNIKWFIAEAGAVEVGSLVMTAQPWWAEVGPF